jgi:3-isopropylmalate/(R)-2-methylmalate dehydratase small subunit
MSVEMTSTGSFASFDARFIALPGDNVDTDRIIPARYLTTIDRVSVGQGLFTDWRASFDAASGNPFPLDTPQAAGAEVLVGGANFGCGSSREHAPWALLANGFRVVVSTRLADIFRANALKNGLLAVEIDPAAHARLMARQQGMITVDLPSRRLISEDGEVVTFDIDPFARRCLLDGVDELGYLMAAMVAIESFERRQKVGPCAP